METLGKSLAKELLAQYLEGNRDFEPISDREQKAKLRQQIEQKRAHRDALQRMVLSLTTLNNGIQCGAENLSTYTVIMRENNEIVRSIMTKKVQQRSVQQKKPTDAPTDVLHVQDKRIDQHFKDTIRFQEQILATIQRSRRFALLAQAKDETKKAQQALDNIQSSIQQTVEITQREEQDMFKRFLKTAIEIGDEQERLEQKRAQVNGSTRRRETLLHGTMEYDSVEPVAHLAGIPDELAATVPCASDEPERDEDDNREGQMGLNFSSIIEDFPIGSTFKNPNDYPETFVSISSPKQHETVDKGVANSSHNKDQKPTAEGKENNRNLRRSSIQRRNSVVATQEQVTSGMPPPSPRKKKTKTSEKVEPQSKPLGKRARSKSPKCIEACDCFADNRAVEPKKKATAATDTPTSKRAPLGQPGPSDNQSDIFKHPSTNVANVKSNNRQQPKDACGKQTAAQKQQIQQPPTTGGGSKRQASKNHRNLAAKRQSPEKPVPEKQTLPSKKRTQNSLAPAVQAPNANGSAGAAIDATMSPVQSSSSHGSLDFGLQSSSNEFDMNVLTDFPESSADMDDLDFLMNDPQVATSSKTKKAKEAKKGDEADSFSFDFEAQDSNESMDQAGNELF